MSLQSDVFPRAEKNVRELYIGCDLLLICGAVLPRIFRFLLVLLRVTSCDHTSLDTGLSVDPAHSCDCHK